MEFRINAFVLLCFFILLSFNCFAFTAQSADCLYQIKVKTGDVKSAGTNSKISLSLFNNLLETITISDLETWGIMASGHDYFERDNLDLFVGTVKCLTSPICGIVLKSDNTGYKSGWYVSYVDVTTFSVPQQSIKFDVSQWLAVDEEPKELTTIRNLCNNNNKLPLSLLKKIV